jgi:phytoene dehydrogenase-like protein
MTKPLSAVIIGAGHNGLVCAIYLARAGYQVQIVEANQDIGGAAAAFEFAEGFQAPGLVNVPYGLNAKICRDLTLIASGHKSQSVSSTISLGKKGQHITLSTNHVSGAGITEQDAEAFRDFKQEFTDYAKALQPLMINRPPRLKDMDRKDKFTLAKLGWNLRFGLGTQSMREFLRVGGINIFDVLNETFDNPQLKAAIAMDAVLGQHMGPRTPNTVLTYLQRLWSETQASPHFTSGLETLEALKKAAKTAGVSIRINARVVRVQVEDDKAVGVELESGERISASVVVSNADAKITFLDLVGTRYLDAMFCHRVDNVRSKGNVAKVFYGVNGLPKVNGLSAEDLSQRLIIAPDLDYVEHAFNAVKYAEHSPKPIVEITVPSVQDPALAPEGHHVVSVSAAYAPYQHRQGWDNQRESFIDKITSLIEHYAPGFAQTIKASQLLTPEDIERHISSVGGHWHQGELSLDQSFMMRPVHGAAQYDTPIKGLYLCGASTHPGGGITGVPGHNAAQRILETRGSN